MPSNRTEPKRSPQGTETSPSEQDAPSSSGDVDSDADIEDAQPAWLPPDSEGRHLLVVDWEDQSERTRMTQALEAYNDEHLVQPPGTVRVLTEEIDVEGLVSSLLTKVPAEHVYLAELDRDEQVESYLQGEETLTYRFDEPPEDITTALNFVITNRGGRLKSPTDKRYKVTRHGYVEVEFEVVDAERGEVEVTLDGQSEPVAALKENLLADLEQLDA